MPNSKITPTAIAPTRASCAARGKTRSDWVRLSAQVAPDLKRELQNQARRAGLSLSEWVRIRLDFGTVSPREVRSFLQPLIELGNGSTAPVAAKATASTEDWLTPRSNWRTKQGGPAVSRNLSACDEMHPLARPRSKFVPTAPS